MLETNQNSKGSRQKLNAEEFYQMIKNIINTTLRNIWKTKGFSFLNIFGLAIGIMVASFIFLWVKDEVSYNDYYKNKHDLYIMKSKQVYDGATYVFQSSAGPLAKDIKTDISGIEDAVRINWSESAIFGFQEKLVNSVGYYADPNVLDLLTVEFVEGSRTSALKDINSIVLSESAARKIFGKEDALGKVIKMNNKESFTVSAVTKDFPKNSNFRYEWVLPFEKFAIGKDFLRAYNSNAVQTLVKLGKNVDLEHINKQLRPFVKIKTNEETSFSEHFLYPLDRLHLFNVFRDGIENPKEGYIKYVKLFSIIAWLVLFMACINFMNLSTARSEKRAKEVAVRKVVGANRKILIVQFLGESIVFAFISSIIAIIAVYLLLPSFNALSEKSLTFDLFQKETLFFFASIILICGLVAGSYPAFFLSGFNPLKSLKGEKLKQGFSNLLRKGLVVIQFTTAIVMMICTVVIYIQINHIKNRDVGFERSQVISTDLSSDMSKHFSVIKEDLLASGYVDQVGLSKESVLNVGSNSSSFFWEGKNKDQNILIGYTFFDPGMIKTLGMKLLAGRNFNENFVGDSTSLIINETFAKLIQPDGDVVGKIVNNGEMQFQIVGVIKNYTYNNVFSEADPLLIAPFADESGVLNIKLKPTQNMQEAIAKVADVVKKHSPQSIFDYKFLDKTFENTFKSEVLLQKLVSYFAILSILISCLGLFGLASFAASQRAKEISIRKVLGATISGLVAMLNMGFIKLVLLACLIAYPLAFWFMNKWLQDYAYRIDMPYMIFIGVGVIAIFIAILTISSQALRVALSNPTKKLRNE